MMSVTYNVTLQIKSTDGLPCLQEVGMWSTGDFKRVDPCSSVPVCFCLVASFSLFRHTTSAGRDMHWWVKISLVMLGNTGTTKQIKKYIYIIPLKCIQVYVNVRSRTNWYLYSNLGSQSRNKYQSKVQIHENIYLGRVKKHFYFVTFHLWWFFLKYNEICTEFGLWLHRNVRDGCVSGLMTWKLQHPVYVPAFMRAVILGQKTITSTWKVGL